MESYNNKWRKLLKTHFYINLRKKIIFLRAHFFVIRQNFENIVEFLWKSPKRVTYSLTNNISWRLNNISYNISDGWRADEFWIVRAAFIWLGNQSSSRDKVSPCCVLWLVGWMGVCIVCQNNQGNKVFELRTVRKLDRWGLFLLFMAGWLLRHRIMPAENQLSSMVCYILVSTM